MAGTGVFNGLFGGRERDIALHVLDSELTLPPRVARPSSRQGFGMQRGRSLPVQGLWAYITGERQV
jgi:hypothetical protein